MVKKKLIIKKLNQIVQNDELSDENNLILIEAKRALLKGYSGDDATFNHLMFVSFYPKYINEITLWLGEPKETVEKKMHNRKLTGAEHKLILTNILIKECGEDEETWKNI